MPNQRLTMADIGRLAGSDRAWMKRVGMFAANHPHALFLALYLVGLPARLWMLPTSGFSLDLEQHYDWARCGIANGLFGVYLCSTSVTHPPLSPVLLTISMTLTQMLGGDLTRFANNPAVVAALKLPNLLFELGVLLLVYALIRRQAGVWWAGIAAGALIFNPGWTVVTWWWGQNDASYTFFMLLVAAGLLNRRPSWTWIAYGLAWLAKFQSIMFFPVLAVLSWRRFGWRHTAVGGAAGALVIGAGVLPFVIGSGAPALRPFGGTVNLFPYITNGAYNLWYWVSGASQTVLLDSLPFIDGVTYFQAGVVLLATATLAICARLLLRCDEASIYAAFAAANLVFFMMPTQIQARYLYPGIVFLALMMAAYPPRAAAVALYVGWSLGFTYNVFDIVWLGIGLLYYPSLLMIWTEAQNALAVTALYAGFLWRYFAPLRVHLPSNAPAASA